MFYHKGEAEQAVAARLVDRFALISRLNSSDRCSRFVIADKLLDEE